jgi:hypothetical protein
MDQAKLEESLLRARIVVADWDCSIRPNFAEAFAALHFKPQSKT